MKNMYSSAKKSIPIFIGVLIASSNSFSMENNLNQHKEFRTLEEISTKGSQPISENIVSPEPCPFQGDKALAFHSTFGMKKSMDAPLLYLDEIPDNLMHLSEKFSKIDIENYDEDLGTDAKKRLEDFKTQIEDYSLEGDLLPQAVGLVAREALMASQKILEISSRDGGTVLYLGRSPSVLKTASTFLNTIDNEKHIQVNFSGTPNIINFRNYEVNDLRNVITQERLSYFCEYLSSKGLNNIKTSDHLYIVDQIGKGAGMNAFLRILMYYYINHNFLESTPKITILLMNFDNKKSHLQENCYFFNHEKNYIEFSGSKETDGKYRSLKVSAMPLSMSEEEGGALDAMDEESVQYYLLSGREYPAFCWTKKYDDYRDSNPELSEKFNTALIEAFRSIR